MGNWVITLIIEVITPFITGRGPSCQRTGAQKHPDSNSNSSLYKNTIAHLHFILNEKMIILYWLIPEPSPNAQKKKHYNFRSFILTTFLAKTCRFPNSFCQQKSPEYFYGRKLRRPPLASEHSPDRPQNLRSIWKNYWSALKTHTTWETNG